MHGWSLIWLRKERKKKEREREHHVQSVFSIKTKDWRDKTKACTVTEQLSKE